MMHLFLLPMLLLSLTSAARGQDATEAELDAAALFANSCATCHVPPDTTFPVDRAWISQLADTAWTDTPEEARAALQAWFRTAPLPLPARVTEPPAEHVEGMGTLTLPEGEAALILKDGAGALYRLSWERTDGLPAHRDRRRALPSGEYQILGLHQVDRTREGEIWHTSATGTQLGRLFVEDGEEEVLALDATIRISQGLRDGKLATMNVTHPSGAGLTLYKDGRRVPVAFRLLAEDGEVRRSGPMRYGWGGGGWASVKPAEHDVTLELVLEEPPFPLERREL